MVVVAPLVVAMAVVGVCSRGFRRSRRLAAGPLEGFGRAPPTRPRRPESGRQWTHPAQPLPSRRLQRLRQSLLRLGHPCLPHLRQLQRRHKRRRRRHWCIQHRQRLHPCRLRVRPQCHRQHRRRHRQPRRRLWPLRRHPRPPCSRPHGERCPPIHALANSRTRTFPQGTRRPSSPSATSCRRR